MAKKFGGKYSPDGSASDLNETVYDDAIVDPVDGRANVMFIPAVVLVFTSLTSGAISLASAVIGAGILALAAWLLRDGLRAEAAFNARKVARRPAFPRKIAATVLTGVGIAIAGFSKDAGLVASGLYGIVAAVLHTTAFGVDPMRDKGMEGIDKFQQDRVARSVDEAERQLTAMKDAISRAGDRGLERRVDAFGVTVNRMFRTIEEDPRDLTGARKFLSVYLRGAKDATVKFADLYGRKKDPAVKSDYEALLSDLEQNFAAKTEKMLLDDKSDMDIEIKVLRDRLQREGLTTD